MIEYKKYAKSEYPAGVDAEGITERKLFTADVEGVESVRAICAVFK